MQSRLIFLLLLFLGFGSFLPAHEGHNIENGQEEAVEAVHEGGPVTWTQWVGQFHLIFLHFPIALINLLVISEGLSAWYRQPMYEATSKFLMISAAVLAPPTAILGLIYSYSASYYGPTEIFLWWHMWFGVGTALLAVMTALIREGEGVNRLYYGCLTLLFLILNITGFLGGRVSFGPFHLLPSL